MASLVKSIAAVAEILALSITPLAILVALVVPLLVTSPIRAGATATVEACPFRLAVISLAEKLPSASLDTI